MADKPHSHLEFITAADSVRESEEHAPSDRVEVTTLAAKFGMQPARPDAGRAAAQPRLAS